MNKIYVRISTDLQSQDRQKLILEENGYNESNSIIFEETFSGKNAKRPELIRLLDGIEKGDRIIITDLTRLARSVKDLWEISDELTRKGATLISIKENVDLETATGRLLFSVIGAVGQFERDTLSERTKEGLRAKKANGVVLGRPVQIDAETIAELFEQGLSAKDISEQSGVKLNTVYYYINKIKKGEQR